MQTGYMYAVIGVTTGLATAALSLRIIARRMTKAGYGYDDVLAIIAYVRLLSRTPRRRIS